MCAALRQAFLDAVPSERRAAFAGCELGPLWDAASAGNVSDVLAFARHAGGVLGPWLDPCRLSEAPLDDLVLAYRASRGEPAAVAALVARHESDLRAAMRSTGIDGPGADEVWNAALAELTVPVGEVPGGLARYAGRGSLRGWLRSVVVRKAMRAQRGDRRRADTDLEAVVDLSRSPELRALQERHRPQVEAALRAGFEALAPRQRTLLRQHYLDGLNIDRLGALHGVHRATAARWIASARQTILDTCMAVLHAELGATDTELDSLLRLVASQLDVSVRRLLVS